ncbi:hypothetical protein [Aquitalea aquatica]|uniref:Uncharacterized protein n=1 Tax=Aquitalea aquatica TaxID=3044273 RepID=A0A838Y678_9NEIS|nr:hypothetical protein [Aquitalea magnusonii]MBA4708882.1 hypothetical protein [Aquitalea magnusonii]
MFQPQGSAPHLHWLSQRLQARTLLRAAGARLPAWLPADWQGFAGERCWLDLATDDSGRLLERAEHCRQHDIALLEVCGQWLPQGEQFGFMLLCGGELPATSEARSWLDCAAPLAGGWLHCGPLGSARYTLHVINAMRHTWQLALQALPATGQPSCINWEQLMQQQSELADKLYLLSASYLQRQGIDAAAYSASEARSNFALPVAAQSHFAANLAILIVLAMQQRETLHSMLQQVFSTLHNT